MTLRIYNTLTGQKEDFKPVTPGEVKMYVCGVTVYDRCHIGHARAGVVFDFVFRSLKHLGYDVTYVRNFTDVDDKIINRAAERSISCDTLVEENIAAFYEDMDALYLLRPDHEPRATGYIAQMQAMIQTLIDKGLAYESQGDVFFSVAKFPEYGKLSKRNLEELEAGARVSVNEAKRDPLDFALWKAAKPGEPKWPSPWGDGRPGWHIECSAMGKDLLGEVFDIHGGGKDLVFPHHENEIAQSHGASGRAPVNYWMHNGFVNINKEKMSKSLGNFFTIREVLQKFDAETIRLYLLGTHYRSPIDFADGYLIEARRHLDRLYAAAARASAMLDVRKGSAPADIEKRLKAELEDDFNSATVVALLSEAANRMNAEADLLEKKKGDIHDLADWYAAFISIGQVMGLFNRAPSEYLAEVRTSHLASLNMTEADVDALIARRNEARKAKDFAQADAIRKELTEKGIEMKDSAAGTLWTVNR